MDMCDFWLSRIQIYFTDYFKCYFNIHKSLLGNIREKHKKYSQLAFVDNSSSRYRKLCVAIQLVASALLISKNYGKDISFVIY